MNCYSQDAVTAMFVSVETGVTTTLTETNQTTDAFHIHQLGTSGYPDSETVWSEDDVRLASVSRVYHSYVLWLGLVLDLDVAFPLLHY